MGSATIHKFISSLFLVFVLLSAVNSNAQTFYDVTKIQQIEVFFSQANWDYQMDTAKIGADGFIVSDSVRINGVSFDSAGVKYKGNSSYNAGYKKNPVTISLDEYKNQNYEGYKDIKLGNGYADPSLIREVISYSILKNYMDCPKSNFAKLFINGVYIGLFANSESINKKFCAEHFHSSANTLIKCNPILNPGPNTKSNLKYINSDSSSYFNFYELKSDKGWNDLVALCDSVTNKGLTSSSIIDWDRFLWMLAFNNALVNLDSYSGVFAQNYYLYKNNSGLFMPVVWDLNMSLGGFPFLGSSNSSLGNLTITNMQQLPTNIHATDAYWPIINVIQSNPVLRRKYIAHLRTIVSENLANSSYQALATQYRALIDVAVQADTNKFYTTLQYQNSLTSSTVVGSYSVPGIQTLVDARVSYLQGTSDFTNTAPIISNITSSNAVYNTDTKLTATVQNAVSVFLYYRFYTDEIFKAIAMYDDGLHDDGAANDKVYGTKFNLATLRAEYYIYAENNDAGKFAPERAAHDFYSVTAAFNSAKKGDIKINEFLALNQNDTVDETGQHEDWIELYNTTSSALILSGLYLTDVASSPKKYSFPANAVIQPYSFLTIFADGDSSTSSILHCSFKLSGTGEMLMLSNGNGEVSDSFSFASQTTDVSVGRCPNGVGPIAVRTKSTFNTSNCSLAGIKESNPSNKFNMYPNPARNEFFIEGLGVKSVVIYNTIGQVIFDKNFNGEQKIVITDSKFTQGIYLVKVNDIVFKRLLIQD